MVIDENYTGRRVRIIGKEGNTVGYAVSVFDFDTGEPLDNAYRVTVVLDATEMNAAQLSYYETDKQTGSTMADENGAIKKDVTVSVAEIDVTAFEVGGANVD